MEMITWQQLGIHAKPVGFLNVDGLYTKLLSFFDDIVAAVSTTATPASRQTCDVLLVQRMTASPESESDDREIIAEPVQAWVRRSCMMAPGCHAAFLKSPAALL